MIKTNPFTPQTGWEPKSFQGRKTQIDHFMKNINEALLTHRPNHMIVLGDWGIGKTSLLKLYKKIAQKEGMLASFCAMPKFSDKDSTKDVINVIIEEILKGFPVIKGFDKLIEEIECVGVSIAGFGGQVTRKKRTPSPQILLTDVLTRLWKYLESKLVIILIDDVQNFVSNPQVIGILRLVLSRDEVITETNYLFILSSTPQGWSDFIDKHDPIGRFFRKREKIRTLDKGETSKVITETLKDSGVRFSKEIVGQAYKYTMGHPYELQVLCSNLYNSQIKGLVSKRQWDMVFKATLEDLGEDYFGSLYRKVSQREKTVLQVFCMVKKELDIKTAESEIKQVDKKYPVQDVRFYIYRLIKKGLIKEIEKGRYRLLDNMFKEYLIRVL